ncbi:MAG: poly-beta-1,6-N-acetyl-D-glucosamine biosynthesis protein PgaD [Methylococcaceae bacterium]|nr:MAG: poly-beta-1,6-N-acetyl-D-glucosamine biosynthesis protein PgaD [Methylococcaceae bacterium]
MSDLIINVPHLQSVQQRLGSWVVAVVCWLLWVYFLVPIVTLTVWLLGVRQLTQEIRWFGGYKSLMELLELYGETILVIALLWLCWTALIAWLHRGDAAVALPPVSKADLCQSYGVDMAELTRCQASRRITVHFDEQGHIVHMEPDT